MGHHETAPVAASRTQYPPPCAFSFEPRPGSQRNLSCFLLIKLNCSQSGLASEGRLGVGLTRQLIRFTMPLSPRECVAVFTPSPADRLRMREGGPTVQCASGGFQPECLLWFQGRPWPPARSLVPFRPGFSVWAAAGEPVVSHHWVAG